MNYTSPVCVARSYRGNIYTYTQQNRRAGGLHRRHHPPNNMVSTRSPQNYLEALQTTSGVPVIGPEQKIYILHSGCHF